MTQPTESHQQVRATLLRCWSEILDVSHDEVSDSSNFFFDGGNSLLAVHLISAVSNELGVEIPLDSLFLDGSFGALLKETAGAVSAGPGSV